MKILHMLNAIEFSGAEIMLKYAAPIFHKNGFSLHALSTGDAIGKYAKILKNSGYYLHHIPFEKSPKYFLDLYRFLRENKFDIVHIHPERAFFWHVLTVKKTGVKRIIRTIHSVFTLSGYLRFKRLIQRAIANKIFSVDFIAVSYSTAEVEKKIFFNKTILIPNWVDQNQFAPVRDEAEYRKLKEELGISSKDIVIVSVGSCTEVKKHDAIITAMAEIFKETKNLIYLHIGEGPLQEHEKILAVKLGISSKIKFLGQIENVQKVLAASDIYVSASSYEGFGLSCLEAASCSIPSVVYNVEGLKDIVKDGENGILVDPNSNAMATAVKELIRNEKLRKQMGIRSRERVLKYFNMQDSLEKLMNIYRGG